MAALPKHKQIKYQTLILQELFENNWKLIAQLRQAHVLPTALCLELPGTAHLEWIWELCKPCVSLWLLLCSPCHGGMTTLSFKMLQNKVFALNNIIAHDAKPFVGFAKKHESNREVACNLGAALYIQWVNGTNHESICFIKQHKEIQLWETFIWELGFPYNFCTETKPAPPLVFYRKTMVLAVSPTFIAMY